MSKQIKIEVGQVCEMDRGDRREQELLARLGLPPLSEVLLDSSGFLH